MSLSIRLIINVEIQFPIVIEHTFNLYVLTASVTIQNLSLHSANYLLSLPLCKVLKDKPYVRFESLRIVAYSCIHCTVLTRKKKQISLFKL